MMLGVKFEFQKCNKYYKVNSVRRTYFVKVKKNLKKEFYYNKMLKDVIPVPHIYFYDHLNDIGYDYIIEEYIDCINLYDIDLTNGNHDSLLFSVGQIFGKAFNIKSKISETHKNIDISSLNNSDKSLYNKYFNNVDIYNGFILFDVAYLCSTNEPREVIKVTDFENCLFDDIRLYIQTYSKLFGKPFISGFNTTSKIDYSKLVIDDMEEFLYIRKLIENI